MAIVLVKMLSLPEWLNIPLMVVFGLLFSVTAIIGFKGLDIMSRVSVPLMFILLVASMVIATNHAGGWSGLLAKEPSQTLTFSAAVTMVFAPSPAARPRPPTGRAWPAAGASR